MLYTPSSDVSASPKNCVTVFSNHNVERSPRIAASCLKGSGVVVLFKNCLPQRKVGKAVRAELIIITYFMKNFSCEFTRAEMIGISLDGRTVKLKSVNP